MPGRSYRRLLLGLAAFALVADLGSKYYAFRELYHRGEHDLVPGWFKFIAQYDHATPASEGGLRSLQTRSTGGDPVMPRVNHGALFGMGGAGQGFANAFFAV